MKKLLCIFLIATVLMGCQSEPDQAQKTVFAMDTVMDLKAWGQDARSGIDQVEAMLHELERRWSATREDSLVSALNRGEALAMSQQEQTLLAQVEALKARTGGSFDPKLGALSSIWGFRDKNYRVPTQQEIAQALAQQQLDMGAALKGYAGDRAVAILQDLNVDSAVLNLGGNVQTYGTKPDGQPWQIGIQDPIQGGNLGVLRIEGTQSIVTSGSYQRYFDLEGQRYHHIMDGSTGAPAQSGLVSVTVICANGLTADALSTALFVMGLERGSEFWRGSEDFEAVFVLADGSVYATQGVSLSGCSYKEIKR